VGEDPDKWIVVNADQTTLYPSKVGMVAKLYPCIDQQSYDGVNFMHQRHRQCGGAALRAALLQKRLPLERNANGGQRST
jgi:hypothetical protein